MDMEKVYDGGTAQAFKSLYEAFGFARGFCLPLTPLGETWMRQYRSRPPHTQGLCLDPRSAFPWASALVLLVRAYTPFAADTGLPGYYIASNAGYHAANALAKRLCERGYRVERMELALSALLEEHRIGRLLKNALLDIDGLGTRTVLYTLVTDAYTPISESVVTPPPCGDCRACVNACPVGAISPDKGLNASRCLRAYMEGADMPPWVEEALPGLLGCELCQDACPRNSKIGHRKPTAGEAAAFDLVALAGGNIKEARALVGKNMCTRERLQAQAVILLKRRNSAG